MDIFKVHAKVITKTKQKLFLPLFGAQNDTSRTGVQTRFMHNLSSIAKIKTKLQKVQTFSFGGTMASLM